MITEERTATTPDDAGRAVHAALSARIVELETKISRLERRPTIPYWFVAYAVLSSLPRSAGATVFPWALTLMMVVFMGMMAYITWREAKRNPCPPYPRVNRSQDEGAP